MSVIPAKAGIQPPVIPAKAGIQASAGPTASAFHYSESARAPSIHTNARISRLSAAAVETASTTGRE